MRKRTDLQQLIPEPHRDLVEAVPRGFSRAAVTGSLLLGALAGSLLTYVMPPWAAGAILVALVAGQLVYKWKSDKVFDERMAALDRQGLEWNTDGSL